MTSRPAGTTAVPHGPNGCGGGEKGVWEPACLFGEIWMNVWAFPSTKFWNFLRLPTHHVGLIPLVLSVLLRRMVILTPIPSPDHPLIHRSSLAFASSIFLSGNTFYSHSCINICLLSFQTLHSPLLLCHLPTSFHRSHSVPAFYLVGVCVTLIQICS